VIGIFAEENVGHGARGEKTGIGFLLLEIVRKIAFGKGDFVVRK
jgi:hypothetical protein